MKKVEQKSINTYAVEIVKEKKGYSAFVLGISDVCATQADTYEGVIKNIKEALELHFEGVKMETKRSDIILMPVYA